MSETIHPAEMTPQERLQEVAAPQARSHKQSAEPEKKGLLGSLGSGDRRKGRVARPEGLCGEPDSTRQGDL